MSCFFFSSRRRHTRCALVTGVQTCALPIYDGITGCPAARLRRTAPHEDQRRLQTLLRSNRVGRGYAPDAAHPPRTASHPTGTRIRATNASPLRPDSNPPRPPLLPFTRARVSCTPLECPAPPRSTGPGGNALRPSTTPSSPTPHPKSPRLNSTP